MSALQNLKDVFEKEAQPSPLKVAGALARYFDDRGSYGDDASVRQLLVQHGYRDPHSVARHILMDLNGDSAAERLAAAKVGNAHVYLRLGAKPPEAELEGLKRSALPQHKM